MQYARRYPLSGRSGKRIDHALEEHPWNVDDIRLFSRQVNPEARATALESIAAHIIDGLRWLSYDHHLPVVRLAVTA